MLLVLQPPLVAARVVVVVVAVTVAVALAGATAAGAGAVAVAAGAAAAAGGGAAEMVVGGGRVAHRPGQLHFHGLQGAVDMDVLGLGRGILGGTFTRLGGFIWG